MNIGLGGTFAVGAYFLMLVILGWASRRARKSNSLADFYLAGRGLGVPVLVLTLYAPQYSGNSLIGYPGEAYRMGFSWMMTVGGLRAVAWTDCIQGLLLLLGLGGLVAAVIHSTGGLGALTAPTVPR